MPETGSNIPKDNKKLSIRLVLNGQSFSFAADMSKISKPCTDDVEIEIASSASVIAPCSNEFEANDCLAADGMAVNDQQSVLSIVSEQFKLIVPIPHKAKKEIEERFTGNITYSSSLLKAVNTAFSSKTDNQKHAVLYFTGTSLNVAICGANGLLYAETLPCSNDEALTYYLGMLNNDFDLSNTIISVCGDSSEKWYKQVKRYYPLTRCV